MTLQQAAVQGHSLIPAGIGLVYRRRKTQQSHYKKLMNTEHKLNIPIWSFSLFSVLVIFIM